MYQQTRAALQSYDAAPTTGRADLVRVAFWLEAPAYVRARIQNPTVEEVRAVLIGFPWIGIRRRDPEAL